MKLKKRIISSILTFAMMAGMVFGTSSLAMAQVGSADDTNDPKITTTVARIDIAKTLTAENNIVPHVTDLSWIVVPVSFQPASASMDDIAAVDMPKIIGVKNTSPNKNDTDEMFVAHGITDYGDQPGAERLTIWNQNYPATNTPGYPNKTFSGSAYIGFEDNASIGVYTYRIYEETPSPLNGSEPNPDITYDQSVYYLNIYVTKQVNAEGKPTGNSTIASMTAWIDGDATPENPNPTPTPTEGDTPTPTPTPAPDGNTPDNGGKLPDSETNDGKRAVTKNPVADTTPPKKDPDVDPTGLLDDITQVMNIEYPFVNTWTSTPHTLTVEKQVIGNYSNSQDEFVFLVELQNDSGLANGTHNITYSDPNSAGWPTSIGADGIDYHPFTMDDTAANGFVRIKLKGGQSFTIDNLYGNIQYEVTEEVAGNIAYYRGAAVATAGHSESISADTTTKMYDNTVVQAYAATGTSDTLLKDAIDGGFGAADWAFINIPDGFAQAQDIQVIGTMKTQAAVTLADNTIKPDGTSEDVKIVFTNSKTVVTPTGLVMTYWPYIAAVIAVLAVVGIFVGVNMKKKKSVNDISAGL